MDTIKADNSCKRHQLTTETVLPFLSKNRDKYLTWKRAPKQFEVNSEMRGLLYITRVLSPFVESYEYSAYHAIILPSVSSSQPLTVFTLSLRAASYVTGPNIGTSGNQKINNVTCTETVSTSLNGKKKVVL